MADPYTTELANRGRSTLRLGVSVLVITTLAYYALGCLTGMNARFGKRLLSLSDDRWEITECLYAAAITVSTVGYTDILGTERLELWQDARGRYRWISSTDSHEDEGFDESTAALRCDWSVWTRGITALAVIVGMGFFLYVVSQMTSFFVEGHYADFRAARRARKRISRLDGHVILCGAGSTASKAVGRFREAGVSCVVVDLRPEPIRDLMKEFPDVPCVVGDAGDEEVLRQAGAARARGLVTTIHEDALNLVVVVTARQLNPDLVIVSRSFGRTSGHRLRAAGASTVSPMQLDAMRIASELVRPTVVEFFDQILGHGSSYRVEAIHAEGAGGRPLRSIAFEGQRVVPIAIQGGDARIRYNPGRDETVSASDRIVVFGEAASIEGLRQKLEVEVAEMNTDAGRRERSPVPSSDPSLQRFFVVCGAGERGGTVIDELVRCGRRFVAIDSSAEALDRIREVHPEARLIEADATDPEVLKEAGVETATGLAAVLDSDALNLVVVVTALQARPALHMVAQCEAKERTRLERAGAVVVARGTFGGRRMANEILSPHITGFMDRMVEDPRGIRVEALLVREGATLAGLTLLEADLVGRLGIRPLALRPPDAGDFVPVPGPQEVLEPGSEVLVVVARDQIEEIERHLGGIA